MRPVTIVTVLVTLLLAAAFGAVDAAPIQWSGNGHYYDVVAVGTGTTWEQARDAAAASTYLGLSGHLASITSAPEGAFITGTFDPLVSPSIINYWLGGYQPAGSTEPAGGWTWVTGEAFAYTNWQGGEPNNAGGAENYLLLWEQINAGGRQWNDGIGAPGYVIEYEAIPEPATALLLALGAVVLVTVGRGRGSEAERRGAEAHRQV